MTRQDQTRSDFTRHNYKRLDKARLRLDGTRLELELQDMKSRLNIRKAKTKEDKRRQNEIRLDDTRQTRLHKTQDDTRLDQIRQLQNICEEM